MHILCVCIKMCRLCVQLSMHLKQYVNNMYTTCIVHMCWGFFATFVLHTLHCTHCHVIGPASDELFCSFQIYASPSAEKQQPVVVSPSCKTFVAGGHFSNFSSTEHIFAF